MPYTEIFALNITAFAVFLLPLWLYFALNILMLVVTVQSSVSMLYFY
jgi:hypothetical protein